VSNLEYVVRKAFKILVKDLPKSLILAVARTITHEHTGDISIDNLLFEVFWVLRVEGFTPVFLVHLVL
jgi:hypothetical protein